LLAEAQNCAGHFSSAGTDLGRHQPSRRRHRVDEFFYIYILKIILKKYTTISKFYTFDIHSTWPMAVSVLTAMGHDG
jgi:hypothetical protein